MVSEKEKKPVVFFEMYSYLHLIDVVSMIFGPAKLQEIFPFILPAFHLSSSEDELGLIPLKGLSKIPKLSE